MADPGNILSNLLNMIPGLGTLQKIPVVGKLVGGVLGKALSGVAGFFGAKPATPELPPGYSWSDYPTYGLVVTYGAAAGGSGRGGSGSGCPPGYVPAGPGKCVPDTGGIASGGPPKTVSKGVNRLGWVIMYDETSVPVGHWDNDKGELIEIAGFTREGIMILQGEYGQDLIGTNQLTQSKEGQRPPPDLWEPIREKWGEEILAVQQERAEKVRKLIYPSPWILIGSGAVILTLIIIFLVRKGRK